MREDFLAAAARREGWATQTEPLFQAMARSREMAFSFARFALGMLFLLNAGGLLAFPVLAQLVGVKLDEHWPLTLLSIAAFTIGVACAAVATLLAFLSMFADGLMIYRHLERIGSGASAMGESKTELEKRLRRDLRLRVRALRFGLLALASFLVGAVFAAFVLMSRIPSGPEPYRVEFMHRTVAVAAPVAYQGSGNEASRNAERMNHASFKN